VIMMSSAGSSVCLQKHPAVPVHNCSSHCKSVRDASTDAPVVTPMLDAPTAALTVVALGCSSTSCNACVLLRAV
jgi:hypothetical protein